MTAVQQCPALELSPLTLCVYDLDWPTLWRWVDSSAAEHIPFGELSPSHCTTALLYHYAPRVGLKYVHEFECKIPRATDATLVVSALVVSTLVATAALVVWLPGDAVQLVAERAPAQRKILERVA